MGDVAFLAGLAAMGLAVHAIGIVLLHGWNLVDWFRGVRAESIGFGAALAHAEASQ